MNTESSVSLLMRLIFILVLFNFSLTAKEHFANNISELDFIISSAQPKDTIVMNDGIWSDVTINFNSKAAPGGPIILRAETPGKVIINGKSKLIFSAPYLMAQDLLFKGGELEGSNSEDADKVILFESERCRLKNSAIVDYNPKDFSTYYYWVFFSGSHNRVDHCTFIGKNNLGPVFGNDYSGLPGGKDATHNRVDHCYFKNIPYSNHNDREIFRIWGYGRNGETDLNGAFFTIEHNLFEHADGEGSEIISLKSNYNSVKYNTIRESKGAIVCRSGNFNRIEGNFILGDNVEGTEGIRISGRGTNVMNNYIYAVSGDGLILMAGEFIDSALTKDYKPLLRNGTPLGRVPQYEAVVGGVFGNNTFVNVRGTDVVLGKGYKKDWPSSQRILLPENNTFINNLIQKSNNGTALSIPSQDTSPPLNRIRFKPNIYAANIFYGGNIEITPLPKGIKIINPKLKISNDGLFRPQKGSPVIGVAVEPFVNEDMDGQLRKFQTDIGADEVSSLPVTIKPLTPQDAGAPWLK